MDIEDLGQKPSKFKLPKLEDALKFKNQVIELYNNGTEDINAFKRKHRMNMTNPFILGMYELLVNNNFLGFEQDLEKENMLFSLLQIKQCKSWSGIQSITIFTSAYPEYTRNGIRHKQEFSCAFNCSYCPKQDGSPRSYVEEEPGVARAYKNKFICVDQIRDRGRQLLKIGHRDLGKWEILVLGGTWESYPEEYQEEFIRDMFFAVNTFWDELPLRKPLSLEEEKTINRTAKTRVVGLTLETRPDTINAATIRKARRMGCTRFQIGIQHIDDDVLRVNNRKCPHYKTIAAIKLLKESGFKIDGHFMPNLPGSTLEKDRNMFMNHIVGVKYKMESNDRLYQKIEYMDPDIQCDQYKYYPTAVTDHTEIKEWFEKGTYVPYPDSDILKLGIEVKQHQPSHTRINRFVRDFFAEVIAPGGGREILGLRSDLQKLVPNCRCMRCREVKSEKWNGKYQVRIIQYGASGGQEYFIEAVSELHPDLDDWRTMYGCVRLRLDHAFNKVFVELNQAALLRELHVYAPTTFVGQKGEHVQHKGLGTRLMHEAESIAIRNGYRKMAIIAAIGSQTFYERLGYNEEGEGGYMFKKLI